MTWAEQAKELADAAERASAAGDTVALAALLKGAAECGLIARLTDECDHLLADIKTVETVQRRAAALRE